MSLPSNHVADESRGIVELTESDHHELLAAEYRRLILDVLAGRTSSIELTELAREVADRKASLDADDEDTVEHVAARLHHVHLPKMEGLGVVSYDLDSHRIDPPRVLITV